MPSSRARCDSYWKSNGIEIVEYVANHNKAISRGRQTLGSAIISRLAQRQTVSLC